MKKAFCFSLIAIIIALASAPALVKADDVTVITPYVDSPTLTDSEIEQYSSAVFLTEYLRNGGIIDLSNTSSDYSKDDLLSDFANFVNDVIGVGFDILDVINPFQSEFEWGKGYPLKPATSPLIEFMGKLPFYALNQDGEDTPAPDENYLTYLDAINGSGFWFKDFPNVNGFNHSPALSIYPPTGCSWYCPLSNFGTVCIQNQIYYAVTYPIFDINIFTSNGTYNIDFNTPSPIGNFIPDGTNNTCDYGMIYNWGGQKAFDTNGQNTNTIQHISYSDNDLTNVFVYIYNRFKNVNIYVDGVLWSYAGSSQSYNIQLSTSTVTPQGERVRWMYDKEIYVDIDKILERLDDILYEIQHTPNTPTIIKFDDLDDLIIDVDGQPAIAVKVVTPVSNIDKDYLTTYGPLVPAFLPIFTPVINDTDIFTIAETSVSPIPIELLEVFGYMFMGVLFIGFIHRLLE